MKKILSIILCAIMYIPTISSSLDNKFIGKYSELIEVEYDLATALPYVFKDKFKLENFDGKSKMSGIADLNGELGHMEAIYDTELKIYFNGKLLADEETCYVLIDAYTNLEPSVRYGNFIDDDFMLNRAYAYITIAPGYKYNVEDKSVYIARNKPMFKVSGSEVPYLPLNRNNSILTIFMVDLDDRDGLEYVVIDYPKEITTESKVKITAYDDGDQRYLDSFILDTPPTITIKNYKPTASTKDYEIDLRLDNDYKFILPESVKK